MKLYQIFLEFKLKYSIVYVDELCFFIVFNLGVVVIYDYVDWVKEVLGDLLEV